MNRKIIVVIIMAAMIIIILIVVVVVVIKIKYYYSKSQGNDICQASHRLRPLPSGIDYIQR